MSVKDQAREASEKIKQGARTAQAKASEAADKTRASAERAYGTAREKAIAAYDSSRENVRTARRKTGEGINEQPLAALAGGLVLGLIAGALLPRSEREKEALRKVGTDINSRAHSAYDAAKATGKSALEEKGITGRKAEDAVRDVVKGVGEAARRSADAAGKAAKK